MQHNLFSGAFWLATDHNTTNRTTNTHVHVSTKLTYYCQCNRITGVSWTSWSQYNSTHTRGSDSHSASVFTSRKDSHRRQCGSVFLHCPININCEHCTTWESKIKLNCGSWDIRNQHSSAGEIDGRANISSLVVRCENYWWDQWAGNWTA